MRVLFSKRFDCDLQAINSDVSVKTILDGCSLLEMFPFMGSALVSNNEQTNIRILYIEDFAILYEVGESDVYVTRALDTRKLEYGYLRNTNH